MGFGSYVVAWKASGWAEDSKAERQKAALERLHKPKKKRPLDWMYPCR